ncbi:MAG: rRNA cytosine-C5-methyltransferase [Muribaculaceae bacterium]
MALAEQFITQIHDLLGDEAQALISSITDTEASVSVRINSSKAHPEWLGDLERVPWCAAGAYLPQRVPFTFDPDFLAGRYYVQDASSMFIAYAINKLVSAPVRYLDLCAAPGGKTTAAIDALPQGSLVVANEIVPLRAKILLENVLKWGAPNVVVTNNAPANFSRFRGFFDVIATDVPCSGEGMMRKDAEAVEQWTPSLVESCAERQRSIIADVWQCLRPGGLLIYSTCTYNRLENELMVEHICNEYGATTVDLAPDASWGIMPAIGSSHHCYRFMPHRLGGEGLFMCVLRKSEGSADEYAAKSGKGKGAKATPQEPVPAQVKGWIDHCESYQLSCHGGEVTALPSASSRAIEDLQQHLKVLHAGVCLGSIKGKNCVPHPSLALSNALNHNAFECIDVDYATAIAYLRGESITLPQAGRGYVLVSHQGAALGFANNLGNRANNLYPKEWRIRSTHAPEQKPRVLNSTK